MNVATTLFHPSLHTPAAALSQGLHRDAAHAALHFSHGSAHWASGSGTVGTGGGAGDVGEGSWEESNSVPRSSASSGKDRWAMKGKERDTSQGGRKRGEGGKEEEEGGGGGGGKAKAKEKRRRAAIIVSECSWTKCLTVNRGENDT